MTLAAQKSTFPIALGVRITGVDDSCFSQTGGLIGNQTTVKCLLLTLTPIHTESYSMITMPNADSHVERVLQEDNTELVRKTPNTHSHGTLAKTTSVLRRPTSSRASSVCAVPLQPAHST